MGVKVTQFLFMLEIVAKNVMLKIGACCFLLFFEVITEFFVMHCFLSP